MASPIESCPSCGKTEADSGAGALKKCTGCFEVAYCSRECQQKSWKEHKGPCKRSQKAAKARVVDDLADAVGTIKLPSGATCQNCIKHLTMKRPQVCSRCKSVTYCSRECQVEHWKSTHKDQCQAKIDQTQRLSDLAGENVTHLFTEWKRRAQIVLHSTLRHSLSRQQFEQQPPTHVVTVNCRFHYNYLTFYPTKPPAALAITDLPQTGITQNAAAMFTDLYNKSVESRARSSDPNARNTHIHFLMLSFGGSMSIVPCHILLEMKSYSWEEILGLFADTKCPKQRKFDSWAVPRQNTLRQQYKIMQSSPNCLSLWTEWVHHVFHMNSKKPRHLTHVAVVTFAYDFSLGKVAGIFEFSVETLEKARKAVQRTGGATAKSVLENVLDVEASPGLLQSRAQYPHNVLLPVCLWERTTKNQFFFPNLQEFDRRNMQGPRISVHQSDSLAANAFRRLQATVQFPEVQSPVL